MSTFNEDYPEFRQVNSGNGSLDRIVQSYAAKDVERARAARARMQHARATEETYQDNRRRDWETQRAMRDARRSYRGDREVIDARGSIDSRAFNEKNELVGYTIDERDRHDPMLDTSESKSRWRSQDGRGAYQRMPMSGGRGRSPHLSQIGLQGGAMGSKRNFAAANSAPSGIPLFVKVAIPILIVLGAILFFLLTP